MSLFIDTATNNVTATVSVESHPSGEEPSLLELQSTPNGTNVYVANFMDPNPTVSVINTSTNTVTATIFVRDYPEVVAVTPDGTKVYMTNIDLTMFL